MRAQTFLPQNTQKNARKRRRSTYIIHGHSTLRNLCAVASLRLIHFQATAYYPKHTNRIHHCHCQGRAQTFKHRGHRGMHTEDAKFTAHSSFSTPHIPIPYTLTAFIIHHSSFFIHCSLLIAFQKRQQIRHVIHTDLLLQSLGHDRHGECFDRLDVLSAYSFFCSADVTQCDCTRSFAGN